MRRAAFLRGALLATLLPVSANAQDKPVAFVDVSVVPMDRERIVEHQTLVVQGGRITALGPAASTTVPANATRVDGRGKFLMPGLTEMHGHIPGANDPFTPENVLFLYIAGGATTVRGMQGNPSHIELRRRVEAGEIIGPRLYLSSPMMSATQAPDPATGERLVREAKQVGYDHIKVHENLSKETYDAIVRTAREVGLPWGGHVSQYVGVTGALAAHQATIDHIDDYVEALQGNAANIPAVAKQTKDAGVAVVPTMPLWEVLRGLHTAESMNDRAELKYVPAPTRRAWVTRVTQTRAQADLQAGQREIDLRNQILKGLSDGGVLVLLGSDAPQLYSVPGFSLQREMETMVSTGMTRFQVLQSGTVNVAKFYKLENEAGTVSVGKRADLLLLDANPLVDIKNMARKSGVMVRGRWLPWSEIQARLDAMAQEFK